MSYVGNTPTQQAFTPAIDYFSGNGSTTAFTLSRPVASVVQIQAVIENVPQNPSSAYTVSGNTITFTSAPPSGTNNIYVEYTSPITQVVALPQNPQVFGNLQFSSAGSRITGDFSNATVANRVMFQTSTTNGGTGVIAIPNGTGVSSNFEANSDSSGGANASVAQMAISSTEARFSSAIRGTGTYLPMTFYTGGSERVRIDTSGKVGIGTSSPLSALDINGPIAMRPSYGTYLVNSYYDGAWKYFDNGVAWGIGNNFGGASDSVTIATAAVNASGANAAITWSPAFTIDTSANLKFNSGYGSVATAYGCRSWVNFNGTGTVAIRGSGNVSSITDNGTGDYTVNFSTAMPDTNYGVTQSCAQQMAGAAGNDNNANFQPHTYSSGSIRGWTSYTDVRVDPVAVNVSVYR